MQYTARKEVRKKEKRLSAALTLLIWGSIMLFFFLYRISMPKEEDKTEVVTTMLINFGDNRNGKGVEEPMEQEGSKVKADAIKAPTPSVTPEPMVKKTEKSPKEDKIISGKSEKSTIKKNEPKENTQKNTDKTTATKQKNNKKNTGASTTTGVKKSSASGGDGQGNAAVGNLIRGRGTKPGSQGTGEGVGNAGDPLGGDGYGDSRVGVDRKLVGFIPGTMGRGGSHPAHSCSATGTIVIAYTVDKNGKIISARRASGVTDPCIVSTATAWVKQFVKAEKANFSSTGTYKISF